VAYDGAEFAGFQRQSRLTSSSRTVQGELEAALSRVTGLDERALRLHAAGRTDAGVHASGQVVSFTCPASAQPARLALSANGLLPAGLRLLEVREATPCFSARFSALGKTYSYSVDNGRDGAHPFLRRTALHVHKPLDVASMALAASALVGEHDFSGYAHSSTQPRDPRRLITSVCIDAKAAGGCERLVTLRFTASGFLFRQVRLMAAALLKVGTGRSPESIAQMLRDGPREGGMKASAAHGLCLERVYYGEEDDLPAEEMVRLRAFAAARAAAWAARGKAAAGDEEDEDRDDRDE
jgi:tRNA pseudouridine38-40 synthase